MYINNFVERANFMKQNGILKKNDSKYTSGYWMWIEGFNWEIMERLGTELIKYLILIVTKLRIELICLDDYVCF